MKPRPRGRRILHGSVGQIFFMVVSELSLDAGAVRHDLSSTITGFQSVSNQIALQRNYSLLSGVKVEEKEIYGFNG